MSQVLPTTSGPDLLVAAFAVLTHEEQAQALERCRSLWIAAQSGQDTETERILASLSRVAEVLGATPGIADYKRIRAELVERGEELEPSSRIVRHFGGSWHMAREALSLTEVSTPRRIEERFRKRRLGKVWRYSEEVLGQTLAQAVEDIGHLPQVAEFEWWRQRRIELATARGEQLHLPSPTPYRRRYGNWELALIHFGYGRSEIDARLERF